MKSLLKAAVVAAVLAAPVLSFAQSSQPNQPLTRAQVREELVQLHSVGYSPLDDRTEYPTHIQAAEARLAAQKATTTAQADTSGYGAATKGSSQAGFRPEADRTGPQSVFFGN